MTDYHTKPLLSCRVPAESLTWARGEAERRDQPFGDFMDSLIVSERERLANHVVNPVPAVAAEDEPAQSAGKNCKHRNMRMAKGICPDCHQPVGYR